MCINQIHNNVTHIHYLQEQTDSVKFPNYLLFLLECGHTFSSDNTLKCSFFNNFEIDLIILVPG